MKPNVRLPILSLLTFFLFIFSACLKEDTFDFDNVQIDIDSKWAANVFNIEASLSDFNIDMDSGADFSFENKDNVLTLLFNTSTAYSLQGDDMFSTSIDPQNFNFELSNPYGLNKQTKETLVFPIDTALQFTINSMFLDSALLNEGLLSINIVSDINHPYAITLKSDFILDENKHPISITQTGSSSILNFELDLSKHYVVFTNQTNTIPITFDVAITPESMALNFPYHLDVGISVPALSFSWLHGQTDRVSEYISQKFKMNMIENTALLRCMFNKAFIDVEVENNVGMPLSLEIDTLMLCNDIDQDYSRLLPPNHILLVNYPKNKGEYATTKEQFEINNFKYANQNTYINFKAEGILNNNGMDGKKYFVTDSARYKVRARIEVPLDIDLYNLSYYDTIPFNIDSLNTDQLAYIIFRLEMKNNFPFGLKTQIYFLDESSQLVDSLFNTPLHIAKAITDPSNDYHVKEATTSVTKTNLESKRLQALERAKYLIIKTDADVNSSDPRMIFYYDEQKLNIKLGIQTHIKTKF